MATGRSWHRPAPPPPRRPSPRPRAACPETIWARTSRFFADSGFDNLIYLSVTPSTASMATTLPEAWTSHYRDSGYEQIDPFLSYCCATLTPIGTGSDYCPDYDYLSGRQQQLIHEAAEFG
ncbi:hypothetical protein GTW51_16130 [Aurantimonas aggregata]|uniref:Transcription factor LuxR-like autoinducer-binding domain-containing protein n=1 Tax=Aurantimonas aggregata TaxID=2047720 RepID=A0A6L9MK51_9HYPH|nr:hypothetical protein [Aurantimonas aggregata]